MVEGTTVSPGDDRHGRKLAESGRAGFGMGEARAGNGFGAARSDLDWTPNDRTRVLSGERGQLFGGKIYRQQNCAVGTSSPGSDFMHSKTHAFRNCRKGRIETFYVANILEPTFINRI